MIPPRPDPAADARRFPSLPAHVAIIMDGNGRWAQTRGWGRIRGHREGSRRVDDIVRECCRLGVSYLTLYAFSTENWNRPTKEVSLLMRLLVQYLKTMDKKLVRNRVALVAQGSLSRLPSFVRRELERVMRLTSAYEPRLCLNLSLSYGGREEILEAASRLCRLAARREIDPEAITESLFRNGLYHPEIPDPDLLIRTGGESRVSNFLLWQLAYAELYFTPTLWPDFHSADLHEAIEEYGRRQRRFGLTGEQVTGRLPSPSPVPPGAAGKEKECHP